MKVVQSGNLHGNHALDVFRAFEDGASGTQCSQHLRLSLKAQAHHAWDRKEPLRGRVLHCGQPCCKATGGLFLPTLETQIEKKASTKLAFCCIKNRCLIFLKCQFHIGAHLQFSCQTNAVLNCCQRLNTGDSHQLIDSIRVLIILCRIRRYTLLQVQRLFRFPASSTASFSFCPVPRLSFWPVPTTQ